MRTSWIARLLVATVMLAGCAGPAAPASPGVTVLPTSETAPSTASPSPMSAATPAPSTTAPSTTATPAATDSARVFGWRSDLDALVPAMELRHPDLYHGVSNATLTAAVQALQADVPSLDDDQVLVGLLRIVAMVSVGGRDSHTGAFIWGEGSYPVHSLPLRLWLFPDGVFVVAALDPYLDLVGARVDTVGGRPIADVLAALDPVIPRDNAQTVPLLTPRYLLMPEVLHGLGLIGDPASVELGVRDRTDTTRTVEVGSIAMSAYNTWAGPYGLHLPDDPAVLYLSRAEEPLWSTTLAGGGTLFVQYNRVDPLPSATVDAVRTAVGGPNVDRVVVDIRHDYGGEVSAYRSVVILLDAFDAERPNRLFVITGRNTYSAASMVAAELDHDTTARFVGEPMGGSTRFFGNSRPVTLPWSKIVVEVSTTLEDPVPGDDRPTIEPDIPTPLTSAAYFAQRDPALEAILGTNP